MLKPQAGHMALALLDPLRQGTAETSGLGAGRGQARAGLCPCLSGPRVQKWTDMKGLPGGLTTLPGRAHPARPFPHPWATIQITTAWGSGDLALLQDLQL